MNLVGQQVLVVALAFVWVDPERVDLGGFLWRLVAFKRVGEGNCEKVFFFGNFCCRIETLTKTLSRTEDMIGDDVFELYVVLLAL
jgi:hypothetical protein